MKATILFSCSITMMLLPSVTSDSCNTYSLSSMLQHFVHEGEPFTISCLLGKKRNIDLSENNFIWYKEGNHTPVSKDQHSRIQQREISLWFLPADLRDSGSYECIRRNATHCSKSSFSLRVFSKSNGSCFNEKFANLQEVFNLRSAKILCPGLESFRAETRPILWYKDCKMIKDERVQRLDHYILINNTTKEDQGSYTCKMLYYDGGKNYNISRDIRVTVIESPPNEPPKILFPRNQTIEIELGSSIVLDCNASGAEIYNVFWKVNDTPINVFKMFKKEVLLNRQPFCTVSLNISKVSKKEYEHPFVCEALNHFGHVAAYIKLRGKVPDYRRQLVGLLLTTLILGIVSVWIYKVFKVDIVLWYRDSCYPLTSKAVSDGKIYDAYVLCLMARRKGRICCLDDFVLKTLPEVLEGQCGYNLFIVGRDDLPGEAVISTTDDTIKQSRRLIIILEPEFSNCSKLEETSEQQIAIYNALICYGIKVILIEVEKIQDLTNMPESIKYIKQKHGSVMWTWDFAEKSQSANTTFWKNVRYQMPLKRSTSHLEVPLLPQIYSQGDQKISGS